MTLDVPSLRSDTPGVAAVAHFNNAGAALPPRPVLDAVTSHLTREAAKSNVHEASLSRIDLPAGGANALVRASLHYYNDESEVERLVRAVAS